MYVTGGIKKQSERRSLAGRLVFVLLLLGALALVGCSGASDDPPIPSDAVAIVGHTPISKAAFDHWTEVEFVTDNDQTGQEPVPSGVVIQPGDYGPCVAHLRKVVHKEPISPGGPRATSTSALKQECESRYRTVREHVLNILIVFGWYVEEGRRVGVSPSDAQVRKAYARFSHERFGKPGELQRYLRHTGESYNDELLRMKIDLLSTSLIKRALSETGGEKALERWGKGFFKRWKARTHCLRTDIVPNCGNYTGPKPVDPRI